MSNMLSPKEQKLHQEYEDILFRMAEQEIAKAEGKRIKEWLDSEFDIECSTMEKERTERDIDRFFQRQSRRKMQKRMLRVAGRVAVILLAVFGSLTVLVLSVEAFRTPILNFILSHGDTHSVFKYRDIGDEKWRLDYNGEYLPGKIPEDYFFYSMNIERYPKVVEFINSLDQRLVFYEDANARSIFADTENAERLEAVTINGSDGYIIEKENKLLLLWKEGEKELSIVCDNTGLQIQEIAESVTRIKNVV